MQLDDFESPKNLAATSMYLEKSSNKVANWIKDSVKIQVGQYYAVMSLNEQRGQKFLLQ